MRTIELLRQSKRKHWGGGFLALGVSGIISLFPIGLSAWIVFPLMGVPVDWLGFVRHGELALCSISILITSVVFIARDLKVAFSQRQLFTITLILVFAAATGIYAVVKAAEAKPFGLDEGYLARFSLGVFGASLIFRFFVTVINAIREDLDIEEIQKEQQSNLRNDFERLAQDDS